ncbi:MAG: hypothetical protein B0W54_15140 [Cellvibrio sp. 79]|nr:MAG: hypothetical protein B0W54_15140 [Cellvibrio sp. 79]
MIERIFDVLSHLLNKLTLKKDFKIYEKLIYDEWRESLSETNKIILDKQYASIEFIQRGSGGARMVCHYSKKETPVFLSDQLNKDSIVAMSVMVPKIGDKKTKLTAKIWVYKGKFFNIDFSERPDWYIKRNNINENDLMIESFKSVVNL